jgi:RND superfamily putative drug exporter
MRLLGQANWWAPRPLRRLYARFGIKEADREQAESSRLASSVP